MALMKLAVFLVVAVNCLEGAELPSYITPCSLSDPNLDQCVIDHSQAAIGSLVKGDSKYKIPNLSPLRIPEIDIKSGTLTIKLTDADIFGFETTTVKKSAFDIPNKHISITVGIDRANAVGTYKIDGRILILPITGEGPVNITFVGGEYTYEFDYDLEKKGGEEFLQITNHKLEYTTQRAHFGFENLFGGDKILGPQTQQFLDEHWKEVQQDLGPALSQTIDAIITNILTAIFETVPFEKAFLP